MLLVQNAKAMQRTLFFLDMGTVHIPIHVWFHALCYRFEISVISSKSGLFKCLFA